MENQLEERLQNIENRLKKLEVKERRRQIFAIIRIVISVLLLLAFIFTMIYFYNQIMDKFAPIEETISSSKDLWNEFSNFWK